MIWRKKQGRKYRWGLNWSYDKLTNPFDDPKKNYYFIKLVLFMPFRVVMNGAPIEARKQYDLHFKFHDDQNIESFKKWYKAWKYEFVFESNGDKESAFIKKKKFHLFSDTGWQSAVRIPYW